MSILGDAKNRLRSSGITYPGWESRTDIYGNRVAPGGIRNYRMPSFGAAATGQSPEQACAAQGGTWDPVANQCILPTGESVTPDPATGNINPSFSQWTHPIRIATNTGYGLDESMSVADANALGYTDEQIAYSVSPGAEWDPYDPRNPNYVGGEWFNKKAAVEDKIKGFVKNIIEGSPIGKFIDPFEKVASFLTGEEIDILGGLEGAKAIVDNAIATSGQYGHESSFEYAEQLAAALGITVTSALASINKVAKDKGISPSEAAELIKSGGAGVTTVTPSTTTTPTDSSRTFITPGSTATTETEALRETINRGRDDDRSSAADRAREIARSARENERSVHEESLARESVEERAETRANRPDAHDPRNMNRGGMVYAENGADLRQHPGEPRGTDDVPAWLTEGEFVVDRDSTRMFGDVLKMINDWEPTQGKEAILRAIEEAMNRAAEMNAGDAVYKQIGGAIQGASVQDAGLGRDLRNRALRERNARARGALLQGGLAGQGIASANQAGLIGQAGLQNRSFTPRAGALEAIGRGYQGEADAEAGYQRRLGDISQSEFDRAEAERIRKEDQARADAQRKEDQARADAKGEGKGDVDPDKKTLIPAAEIKSLRRITTLAASAYNLTPKAAPAIYVAQDAAADPTLRGATIAGIAAGGDAGAVKEFISIWILPAVRNAVEAGTITQENESAYTRMVADITDLTTVALNAQGSGPKTDFDFIVAARATANLESTPKTLQDSMKRMIDNAGNALRQGSQEPPTVNLSSASIPPKPKGGVSAKAPEGSQKEYDDNFEIGDRFVDQSGITYEFTSEGTLTQTAAGDTTSVGTTYSGNYIRYVNKRLEIYSFGSWYPLFKVSSST